MKNTIQKSIDVLDNLVTKYIVIKNKINENVLNQQNYQQLENRLNNLEKLFSDNSGGGSGDSGNEYVYTVSGFGTEDVNGNYYDSGETNISNQPIYTNGKIALSYDNIWYWHFHLLEYPSDTCVSYWLNNAEVNSPVGDESTGWKLASDGMPPIGTVSAYAGGDLDS